MSEKIENARMQQKHDTASNWEEVSGFVPKSGEFIVYDKDEYIPRQRMKIGDGESSIGELNYITGEVYVQKNEPLNAGEGAVWIVPEGSDRKPGTGEIIGYKYGEAILPILPNWDRVRYKFGVIYKLDSKFYFEAFEEFPIPIFSEETGELDKIKWPLEKEEDGYKTYYYRKWSYDELNNIWLINGTSQSSFTQEKIISLDFLVWISKNLIYGEEIILKTQTPIAVYQETEE